MISDDETRKILDTILKTNKCLERIKEVVNMSNKRVYSGTGISEYVLHLEDSVAQHYILGTFPGCVVLSRTTAERALKEELAKKGYPDRCLEGLNLIDIIESAKEEGIISKDHTKKAHEIRERGNKYVHAIAKNAKGKKMSIGMIAKSPTRIEDWISTNIFIENQEPEAKKSFEDVVDILSELYSEKRYPV
jgi:hypothetical protein